MAMDSSAQPCHQEIMCSQSETLESMLVCRKSNEEKTKARPADAQALKCPRCDSTNTKFCYYNNYSLTQPRYFCKSCRRYWTKGGTLRNVPVGGGCRKNKRSSLSSSSKSKISMQDQPTIRANIPLTSDYAQMGLDHGHDWINPNMPLISDHHHHHGVMGGGAGLFDALRGTGLFLETPSRGFHEMHYNGLMGQEMGLINHVGFDEELMSGGGAVNFPWQMMTSSSSNGGDGLELSWINGINGHGLLNTPLM